MSGGILPCSLVLAIEKQRNTTNTTNKIRTQQFAEGVAFAMRVSEEPHLENAEQFVGNNEIMCRASVSQIPHFRLGVVHGLKLLE